MVVSRPVVKPALRRLWRHPDTLQLGIEAPHALLVTGVGEAERRVLALLDGSRSPGEVAAAATAAGVPPATTDRLLTLLAAGNALDDAAAARVPGDERERQRLEPDRLSLSLRHPAPGAAAGVLARRRAAAVSVHGAGRVGATVSALLAAAGIGTIGCVDGGPSRPADVAPGGLTDTGGETRAEAVTARVRRTFPATRIAPVGPPRPDLAILAPAGVAAPPEVLAAVREQPHLLVTVRETVAVVGPLVLPGRTPCLRCLELARADRDPQWPGLAAEMAMAGRPLEPCEVALATLAASMAVLQALTWLDDGTLPATAGGVLETDPSGARTRRRSLSTHPSCGCAG